ncbi:1880_t:CDS:2, partial [Diversispora eburnea]
DWREDSSRARVFYLLTFFVRLIEHIRFCIKMANTQSKVDSLEEQNSKLVAEIAELKREKAEFLTKEAGFIARIIELEHTLKDYEARFVNLERKDNEKSIHMAKIDDEIKEIKNSSVNATLTEMENSVDNPASDITNNASNSDELNSGISTSVKAHNAPNSNVSDNASNSETKIKYPTSSICMETKSSEGEEIEFLERAHKEWIRDEIKERNRDKKLSRNNEASTFRDQELIQKNSTPKIEPNASEPISQTQSTISSESGAHCSAIIKTPYNQKVEQGLICELSTFTNEKSLSNSISDKQILDGDDSSAKHPASQTPGSASHLAHLFDKAKKTGQKEILRWYCYSEEFEIKVRDISLKNEHNDQMARTQIYNEMEPFLPGIKRDVGLVNEQTEYQKVIGVKNLHAHVTSDDISTESHVSGSSSSKAYTEETGFDPWITSESPQIEKTDNHLSGMIKISKFPEEKDVIIEAVHKRFPFLSYTNSNAWYRD